MKRFRYLDDRLFQVCCLLYALNRWCIKPRVHSPFMRYHFNDMLLIPCALPVLLLLQRWLQLRNNDGLPSAAEIALHLFVWSILFEGIGPHIMRGVTGDPWDVVSYFVGGIGAWLWWHQRELIPCRSRNEL